MPPDVSHFNDVYNNLLESRREKTPSVELPILTRLLVATVVAMDLKNKFDKTGERPDEETIAKYSELFNAVSDFEIKVPSHYQHSRRLAFAIEKEEVQFEMAIPGGIGEMLGYRLSRPISGLHVPEIQLLESEPMTKAFRRIHYVKAVPGGYCASRYVPRAIPLYFLAQHNESVTPKPIIEAENDLRLKYYKLFGLSDEHERQFSHVQKSNLEKLFNKPGPLRRDFYADFGEKYERDPRILEAARWDSEARLKIYAYRLLLGCAHAHNSNILVDNQSQLHVVDHEKIVFFQDTADISDLFLFASNSERVMKSCRAICQINERHIKEALLSNIPINFWPKESGVLASPKDAVDYFVNRLTVWRQCFS